MNLRPEVDQISTENKHRHKTNANNRTIRYRNTICTQGQGMVIRISTAIVRAERLDVGCFVEHTC